MVIGVGPGIGAACARKWATNGYKVALLSRSKDKVAAFEKKIENSKGYACDCTNQESMNATVAAIEKDLGEITSVVYNAGGGAFKKWPELEVKDLERGFATNCLGLLMVTKLVAPKMVAKGSGTIAITGATASLRGKPFTAGFAPAKGAQRMLAQSLARDLGPKGVHVFLAIIDGGVDPTCKNDARLSADAIAQTYWDVHSQHKSCWTFELDVRPSVESW